MEPNLLGPATEVAIVNGRVECHSLQALQCAPMWHRAGHGTIAAMEKATAILGASGVEVEEVNLANGNQR